MQSSSGVVQVWKIDAHCTEGDMEEIWCVIPHKKKKKEKKASLKAVQIESITSNMKLQPSPASPSPSEVYFCSHCTSHKETYLNLPINNINLGFISCHFFEALVKQSMGLCQGLPLRAHFQILQRPPGHAVCRASS